MNAFIAGMGLTLLAFVSAQFMLLAGMKKCECTFVVDGKVFENMMVATGSSAVVAQDERMTEKFKELNIAKCPPPFMAHSARYRYNRTDHEENVLKVRKDSTVVVIGANVGATDTDFSWKLLKINHDVQKVFVEPIPPLFEKLTENVKEAGIRNAILENSAIGDKAGKMAMYCWDLDKVKPHHLPTWFLQICSFDRDRLYKNEYDTARALRWRFPKGNIDIEEFANKNVVKLSIDQNTVGGILKKNSIALRDVSVLQIDTEGFDYNVVKQLPFDDPEFRPCLVVWEDVLLDKEKNLELIGEITRHGYGVSFEAQNTVMYRM